MSNSQSYFENGAIADLDTVSSFCRGLDFQHEQLCWFTPDYSSLWQPLRRFPHLTTSTMLVALYCGIVFAYLASPLVLGLLRSLHPHRSLVTGWRV